MLKPGFEEKKHNPPFLAFLKKMGRRRGTRGRGRASQPPADNDVEAPLLAQPAAATATPPLPALPASASTCALTDAAAASSPASADLQRRLRIGLALASAFCVIEAVGGAAAHSLAIATDAAHLASDGLGLAVALWAAKAASAATAPDVADGSTYGAHRAEVLAALASTACTWVVTGALVIEAAGRITHPPPIDGGLMFGLGLAGVAMNVVLLATLGGAGHSHGGGDHSHDDHDHAHSDSHSHAANVNARAAWLHVVGDLVQSIGVAVAGAAVYFGGPRFALADPLCTFLFAALVMATTVGLSRDLAAILMERAPADLPPSKLAAALRAVQGVASVSDLHCWLLKPSMPLATAHIRAAPGADTERVRAGARAALARAGVSHATVEVESGV